MNENNQKLSRAFVLFELCFFSLTTAIVLSHLMPSQSVRVCIATFAAAIAVYCRLPKTNGKANESSPVPNASTSESASTTTEPKPATRKTATNPFSSLTRKTAAKPSLETEEVISHRKLSGDALVKALLRAGHGAYNRGKLVEAYFWTYKAKMEGGKSLAQPLSQLRDLWVENGMPNEYDNVRVDFPEESGSFARALLRIVCGINAPAEVHKLRTFAQAGHAESIQYFQTLN